MQGFHRIAASVPALSLADPAKNLKSIIEIAAKAERKSATLVILPELSLTGASCGDLFRQTLLLDEAENALVELSKWTKFHTITLVVGLPLRIRNGLYNCTAVVSQGIVRGIVPQEYFPNHTEFKRHFSSGSSLDGTLLIGGLEVPVGTDLLFASDTFVFGIETGADSISPLPPSIKLALSGAKVILNPSFATEGVGESRHRRERVCSCAANLCAGYVYVSSGMGESTTDALCGGHVLIAENGELLYESKRFMERDMIAYADIDIQKLTALRLYEHDFPSIPVKPCRTIRLPAPERLKSINRKFDPRPFVPSDAAVLAERCEEVFTIQANALAQRLEHVKAKKAVIGLSGGLDSALALLVACEAADILDWESDQIIALSMPGFGTGGRTRNNARDLASAMKCSFREVDITTACRQHFIDIGHNGQDGDVTFENTQARERTQILMDITNKENALLVGTGDLSEIALGWCTYNADHMSMYNVNCGVPKTLVREMVRWFAMSNAKAKRETLLDILETPVSPELLPRKEDGSDSQCTESIIGPYELHDFFLYHTVRYGASPEKLLLMAQSAFEDVYRTPLIKETLKRFWNRFFRNQFKRSCAPEGPRVGTVSLSARTDWRMPSDANPDLWVDSI